MHFPECRCCYLYNDNRDSLDKDFIFACLESPSSFLFSFPYPSLFLLIFFLSPFSFPFSYVFLAQFLYLNHNFLIKHFKNICMKAKKEKKNPTEQKLKTGREGMVRVTSAILLHAGRVSASFIVKMQHMDNMVCCHQNMVLKQT